MNYKIARYGWLPDLPDQRDHLYAAPVERLGILPARVDLCPPVYDQGRRGSCTADAISLPKPGEPAIGGQSVVGVGYDEAKQWFVIRNSWGDHCGPEGYFKLPYAFLTDDNLATDFWTIRLVQ